ncbi:MAG: hypothetical protein IKZ99_04310 [Salinivirgaceae bacterium]|nr:hypothetical protein [Salinivirgaceae bacterium]
MNKILKITIVCALLVNTIPCLAQFQKMDYDNVRERYILPSYEESTTYFKRFAYTSTPSASMLAIHQPTLEDCFSIFKPEKAPIMFYLISVAYSTYINAVANEDCSGFLYTNIFEGMSSADVISFNSNDLLNGTCRSCPKWLLGYAGNFLPDVKMYKLHKSNLIADDEEMSFFCRVNDRWVYIDLECFE